MNVDQNSQLAARHFEAGNLLKSQGQLAEAIAEYHTAIALRPDLAEAHNNLGNALRAVGKREEAIVHLRKAAELLPGVAAAHVNLASILLELDRDDAAAAASRRAVELQPDLAMSHHYLGLALSRIGAFDGAIASFEKTIALQPDHTDALSNLGNALLAARRGDEAIGAYRKALAIQPDHAGALGGLAVALHESADFDQAIACGRRAIKIQPDNATAHWNLGNSLLMLGDYSAGWPEFEWRWKIPRLCRPVHMAAPKWDGGNLSGRRILIFSEWAMGDAIQAARYLPMVAARGGRIILLCQRELHRLLHNIAPIEQLLAIDQPVPACDAYCGMLSLPAVLGTNLQTIPAGAPYIPADPNLSTGWAARMPRHGRLKVGLVWLNKDNPPGRSPPPAEWGALAGIANLSLYSLQKPVSAGSPPAPPGLELTDWTAELNDLADTAALISQLDLVVAVDSVVAHLAGAMGKPVWVLLKHVPDWRWMMQRTDSPWYPSMRLLRQKVPGDWQSPLAELSTHLRHAAVRGGSIFDASPES